MEKKSIPIEVLASVTTGILLCNFGDVQEASDWIMGHPLWTHEFASRSLCARLKELVFEQHPQLESLTLEAFDEPSQSDAIVERLRVEYGDSLEIVKGVGCRAESPLETLRQIAPDKPVIAIVV